MLGDVFAILAAASNGTIGIFNRFGFSSRADYTSLAFYKCLGAFLLLAALASLRASLRGQITALRPYAAKLGALSFFGIFVLYFFETWAFSLAPIPVVSFLTYASGIVAVLLGIVFLKETLNPTKAVAILLVFVGIYLMFQGLPPWDAQTQGAVLAVVGGTGYSLFLFLWKKFEVPSGLATLTWIFGFGSIFLAVPFVFYGAAFPEWNACPSIAALILVPTLGGYYFTGRALSLTEASRVQIIETSDPLFSSAFAFFLFEETLTAQGTIGATSILTGLVLLLTLGQRAR